MIDVGILRNKKEMSYPIFIMGGQIGVNTANNNTIKYNQCTMDNGYSTSVPCTILNE